MSWSINVTGLKAAVAREVAEQLDQCAAAHEGTPEADDIAACKARALALLAALDLSSDDHSTWNGAIVIANGSHGTTENGLTRGSVQLSVTRTTLAPDAGVSTFALPTSRQM